MSLKSWVLHRVHDMNGIAGRNDLPPRVRPLKSVGPLATLVIAYRN